MVILFLGQLARAEDWPQWLATTGQRLARTGIVEKIPGRGPPVK